MTGRKAGQARRTGPFAPARAALRHVELIADHVRALRPWPSFGLAILAGGASAGAMAPLHVLPVLFVTLPLLVWLIDGSGRGAKGVRRAALFGWGFGFGFFLCGLYWIGFAFLVDADHFGWMIPFVAVLLPSGLGLFSALAAGLARALWSEGASRVFLLAGLWSVTEWLRGHLLTGFPWNLLGYGWAQALPMLQTGAFIGIYGLSLITALATASMAVLGDSGRSPGKRMRLPLAAIALLAALYGLGLARLELSPTQYVQGVRLRIIQARLDQRLIADGSMGASILARYLSLSSAPGLRDVTHVVWPEAAVPFPLEGEPDARAMIAAGLGQGTVLIAGTPRIAQASAQAPIEVFNSMRVIAGGEIVAAYDKAHLVPFGEYLPLAGLLERLGLSRLTGNLGSFSRGPGPRTLAVPGAPPVGPLICYEIIFPGAVIDHAERPLWLVNLTDDSWFGTGAGPLQHFDAARMRAVEEGLPAVRAANKGVAAVIGPKGEIVALSPQGAVGALDGPLPAADSATVYARYGDLPFAILLGGLFIFGLRIPRDRRR